MGKGLALQVSRPEFGSTLLMKKPGIMARAHNPITGREEWRQIEPRHSLAIQSKQSVSSTFSSLLQKNKAEIT